MAITFGDEFISIDSIADLTRFALAMGGITNLSLEHAIVDEKKNVLIAAKRPLRENLLLSLETREQQSKFTFIIENSATLRAYVAKVINLVIQKKLTLSDFSFAAWLLNKKEIDIYQVVRSCLNNDFFFITLCKIIYENSPIFSHLIETALLATGLYVDVLGKEATLVKLNTIFMAAFLHDYSLISVINWEEKDIFPSEGHDIESAALLSSKKLPDGISRVIRESNKLSERYCDMPQDKLSKNWYSSMEELAAAILNMTEYFLACKRLVHVKEIDNTEQRSQDEMAEVIYQLSLQTQHGAFPYPLLLVFQSHYQKYQVFFEYGKKIAQIEQACRYKKYALAYPKPRATQVLCQDHQQDCIWRQATNRITIVQSVNKVINRYGNPLPPGEYDKCYLTEELPNPPFNI